MYRIALVTFAALAVARAQSAPKAPPADLAFEVATLKAAAPGQQNGIIRPAPGGERYVANNLNLRLMLSVAYQLKLNQITGGPSWLDTDTWDMNGKAEHPSSGDELHVMLQNLLKERFQIQMHREKKELPIYVLSVDGQSKMTAHEAANSGEPWIDQTIERVVRVKMTATRVTMPYFAWRLGQLMDRPVVDQTGLTGGFDFNLAYTRELPPGIRDGALLNGEPIDTSGPTLFESLRKQLGLKLEARKGPLEVLVLDKVEKPAAQ